MVQDQIASRGVKDPAVLQAMSVVQRHLFVPLTSRSEAYDDHPLPIGEGQTISQPYIVAAMSEALKLRRSSVVLEIGTGSGYQTAVLARLAKKVYSIEILFRLGKQAASLLVAQGYKNVQVRVGDGYQGWPEKAPFDGIILTAAPKKIPPPCCSSSRSVVFSWLRWVLSRINA